LSRVACIGLGTMGGPMAGHLLDAGHEVAPLDRELHRERRRIAA
jgi:3-hydroxyisobutyrate dehydrogenase-like beta-hydroxyacid dehydrogenase